MAEHVGHSPAMCSSRRRALRAAAGGAGGLIHAECAAEQLEPRILLAAITWDGGGDGSSWSDPANWSGDRLPRPRDVVVIGADASINIGGKGERITVRRLESQGSLTLHGGSLRTRGAMLLDGEINVLANSTLAAGKRFHLGAVTQGDGARLVLRGASIFVDQSAHITGLSRFSALAPDELRFAGSITAPMITLDGGDSARTIITGLLDASNQRPRDPAGAIHIFGGEIYVQGATIDARGRFNGGNVRIGGDLSGRGDLPRAQRVYIDHDSIIRADSKRQGDGGTVIVWSDARTIFDGRISASAGRLGGDGGLIETSSKGLLSIRTGLASALARRGDGGTWLLDPYDVLVDNLANFGIAITPGDPTIFAPTGSEATVSTASIVAALNTGTSVTITTDGDGGEAGDIFIFGDIIKTGGGEATLTFNAERGVFLAANISSVSGPLNVVVQANSGIFNATAGGISTNGGSLNISSHGFDLGGAASLSTQNGNFALVSFDEMTLSGTLNFGVGHGNIEAVSGNILATLADIQAASLQMRAYAGSVQVAMIEATVLSIVASNNVVLGGGSGGLFTAYSYLFAHAGTDGTGTILFNPLVSVRTEDVRLQAGDGVGGAPAASVNAVGNSPIFRGIAGGATTPASFSIRQDASITDLQIPGPTSFGAASMPPNLSLRSDDGSLTITTPAKVQGVNLTVASFASVSLGVNGLTMMPANLFYDNTPPSTIIAGTLQTIFGGISFPSNVVLDSPSVFIVSPSTIEFYGTINGGSNLIVTTPGQKDFIGAIGNSAPLLSLSANGGTTRFYSNVTAASITINTAAVIFYTVTMTASTIGPIFQSTLTVNHPLDELHIRGASPAFLGGVDSVSGPGILSIAPASNAATMEVGGTFLDSTDIAAIAQGFTRVEFGSDIQDGPVVVSADTFRNPTRFLARNGHIHHGGLAFTAPGAGVTFATSGSGYVIANGNIETRGGVIEVGAPFVVNTGTIYLNTTQFGASAGADIRLLAEVLAGDGQVPNIEFRIGDFNLLTLAAGIGTEYEPFNAMIVYDAGEGAIRTSGDLWLNNQFETGAPFEIAADVQVWAANMSFLRGIRTVNGDHSLTLIGGGDLDIHGATLVGSLDVQFSDGTTSLFGNVSVANGAFFNSAVTIGYDITLNAEYFFLFRPVNVNGFALTIETDGLNIFNNISPGGPGATLSILTRTPSQVVSLNDTDSGLWLAALPLSRILDGFALLRFGNPVGTATLAIGNATFSDPVHFIMAGPGGSIVVNGPLTGTGDASFRFIGPGSTTVINGNITTNGTPLLFDDAVILGNTVTISTIGGGAPGADIEFLFTVNSESGQANGLSLLSGIGNISFGQSVGGQPGGTLGTLSLTATAGSVFLAAPLVSTSISQTWNATLFLQTHATLSGGAGSLNLNSPIIAGPFDLTLQADTININDSLSGSGSLRIEPFTLTRDVFIYSVPLGGALIIDPGELDNIDEGWNSVTFGKDDGEAQMVVGGGDYPNPTRFVMDGDSMASSIVIAGEVNGTGNGTITIRGGGSTTHLWANIRTQGNAITIFDRVILHGLNLKLDSTFGGLFPLGGKIQVHDDIDSQQGMERSLEIDAGDDEIELFGKIGDRFDSRLGQFITGNFSRAILRGGIIKTIGQQLYQGPVNVPVALLLSTLGAPITFQDEVVGDDNLTIGDGTGETTFNDESNFDSLTIEFGSTRTFNGAVNIGTLTVLGGIVNFNADGKIGDGTLVAGTLSGTATIFIDGEFEWAGGLVEGDGLLVVRPGGVFSFGGASERTLARDIEVLGSLLWTSGHLFLRSATVFILPGGVFEVRSSGTMLPAQGAVGALDNDGLIIRETPGAAAFVGLTVTNTGEIRIADGSLKITPEGGAFTNNGLIDLGPAGSLIVRGDFVQSAGATLAIRIAGPGVAEFGRLIVLLGGATLGGTVSTSFVNGFVPQAGDEFRFLQSVTRTDVFAIENLEPPPPNLRADIEYDPDGARLVISPGLRADSDNDGHLTVQDIFHFLTQWFAGNADFDGDGQTTIDDLFAFLASWFAG